MSPNPPPKAPARSTPPRTTDSVLARLTRLHPKIIDLSLDRVHALLARLDHPERRIAPVVHVAGTNGKGSVIALLRAMLAARGLRVQAYTSPHLVRFHERIRLADGPIAEDALLALLERCETANGHTPITFFEITTAAAFLAFADEPADVLLLETGLGGRLDATNVIDRPALSIITPVSIDHVQYLGDTLEAIAFEKAGILKRGVPAVIGPQPPAALSVIETRAAAIGAPLNRFGREWSARRGGAHLRFGWAERERSYPLPALPGAFQVENAGIALAAAQCLEHSNPTLVVGEVARAAGLRQATWPARLQRLSNGPLVDLLPPEWELWLDGGHNAAAGAALAAYAQAWSDRPLDLVYGMLNTKAARDFVRPLVPLARGLHAVRIPDTEASLSAEEAAAEAAAAGMAAEASAGVAEAVRAIVAQAPPGRILICGSLYLAGSVLAENG